MHTSIRSANSRLALAASRHRWLALAAVAVITVASTANAQRRADELAWRRARLLAEPHRVKEWIAEGGGEWCGTEERFRRQDAFQLAGLGRCLTRGAADLPANRDACIPEANTPIRTVRLKFHVFREDSGQNAAATQEQVDAQVALLNTDYAAARIRFVHTTAFVNSSQFRSLSYFENSEEAALKNAHADQPARQHNIYVTHIESDERGNTLLGVSTFPWDDEAVGAGGGTILDDDEIGAGHRTLVHELGHALGLWHTHHGVREVEECSACWERADGRDADTTGDLCSDTPPTPVNYKCDPPGGTDPCSGASWGETATQNFMGYAPDACYREFTRQQAGRMRCWINDRLSGWVVDTAEVPTLTLGAPDASAAEAGPDAAVVSISRSGDTLLPLIVPYTLEGTAQNGVDFLRLDGSATLPAGARSINLRMTPIDDALAEETETMVLILSPGAGYTLTAQNRVTVTLQDNDTNVRPSVTFTATTPTTSEGAATPAIATVNRTGATAAPLEVLYTIGGNAQNGVDYPSLSGSARIPAGSASITVPVTATDDTAVEGNEAVILTLRESPDYLLGHPATASMTLVDNDGSALPLVTIEATDPVAAEPGTDSGLITVRRTGSTAGPLVVRMTVGGTATLGQDVATFPSDSVSIPAGSATATLNVTALNDAATEANETVVITLRPDPLYTLGDATTATVTVFDDDAPVGGVFFEERFDAVTAPALPTGWTTDRQGAGADWATALFDGVSPPNLVFAVGVSAASDNRLNSPPISVPAGEPPQLSFVHGFTYEDGFDGAVLELAVGDGPFDDLVGAGGSFLQGGYNGTISAEDESAIAGRRAWTGDSGGNVTTVVALPRSASGKTIRLRWRAVTDPDLAPEGGWALDNIALATTTAATAPVVTLIATDALAGEAASERGVFLIRRTGSLTTPLAVAVGVAGTATSGQDYTALPTTLTLPAGSASGELVVVPLDDTAREDSETVVVTLAPRAEYVLGEPSSATVSIVDNDAPATDLGTIVFAENFDQVARGELPAGWHAVHVGDGTPWRTEAYDFLTPPHVAFAPDPEGASDNALVSPPIAIATAAAQLSFEHGYLTEEGYDGGVLEIAVGNEAFQDIVAAGGQFLRGGYSGRISADDGSPIAGRLAWTGETDEDITTTVQLPPTAAGQTIYLRWRMTSDGGVAGSGWGIDTVRISEAAASATPVVSIVASDAEAAEQGPDNGAFTISRTGPATTALTVELVITGSARNGVDFATVASQIQLPAGSSTLGLTIRPINDTEVEGNETVTVTLAPAGTYALGTAQSASLTLLDNGATASVVFAANFDDVAPPALPPGWSADLDGAGLPWVTAAGSGQTPPNGIFAADPDALSDNRLTSPLIPITTAAAQLSFVNSYRLEPGYDGGVLEIQIGQAPGAAFQDILAAGGTFVSGGYDANLSTEDGSPIAGRRAWTGDSGGPIITRVNLPPSAAGQSIRLRWRCASDLGVADEGWAMDTITITETTGANRADLVLESTPLPATILAESPLQYSFTVANRGPVVARDVVLQHTLPAGVRLLTVNASQGTVTGTNVLTARLGLLNQATAATLTLTLLPDAPGPMTASASVAGAEVDPNPANNTATVSTLVQPTSTPTSMFTNPTAATLADAGPAQLYPSTIRVAGFAGTIGRVRVTVDGLSHSFPEDLDAVLVGPRGQAVLLFSDAGGSERFALNHVSLTFDDQASAPLPRRAQIVTGTYRPTDYESGDVLAAPAPAAPFGTSLAVFNGTDPNGEWKLFVFDDSDEDGGRWAGGWRLALTRMASDAVAPRIVASPAGQTLTVGARATLSVTAEGTAPLSYQWHFNGDELRGETGSTLVLPSVTPAQNGIYWVRVSNAAGAVLSAPAEMTVASASRLVRLRGTRWNGGARVEIPVELVAQGDEQRLAFSLRFDPNYLRFRSARPGDVPAATIDLDANQIDDGRIGLNLSLPAPTVFAAGPRTVAVCVFDVLPSPEPFSLLAFSDAPVSRQVRDRAGQTLPTDWASSAVIRGEADGAGPRILSLDTSVPDRIQLTLVSENGRRYRLEASSDLQRWSEVVTQMANGTRLTLEERASRDRARFFRVLVLP